MVGHLANMVFGAIAELWQWWAGLTGALVPVLSGAGLTLGLQALAERKKNRDTELTARLAAARDGAILATRFAVNPGQTYVDILLQFAELVAPPRTSLMALDETGEVARWWTRQMRRLAMQPTGSNGTFTKDEMAEKGRIAHGVQQRLYAWARGQVPAEQFRSENDARFDAALAKLPVENVG